LRHPDADSQGFGDLVRIIAGHSLLDARKYDSFGVGFCYNEISNDLKRDVAQFTAGTSKVSDEKGVENLLRLRRHPPSG